MRFDHLRFCIYEDECVGNTHLREQDADIKREMPEERLEK